MLHKVKNISIWLAIVLYFVFALSFTSGKKSEKYLTSVNLIITDTTLNNFIDKKDIIELIERKTGKFIGISQDSVNIAVVEQLVNQHPAVKEAEVYKNIYGGLTVELSQRNPVLRVITGGNKGFYIDEVGVLMPLSDKYIKRVPVASGSIPEIVVPRTVVKNVSDLDEEYQILKDLFQIGQFIYSDEFWKSQIEQIYITEKQELELVGRVGEHIIIFGNADNYKTKFRKLKALYENGLNKIGWNKYKTINLKYDKQVVCTKR